MLLSGMRWILLLVMVLGCGPPDHPPLPPLTEAATQAASAGGTAWAQAGLRVVSGTACRLEGFRAVVVPASQVAWFDWACPKAWACLGWGHPITPIAYVSPRLHPNLILHAIHHEYLHALGHCYGRWGGWYDAGHTDQEVWEQGGPSSVETLGEAILDMPPPAPSSVWLEPVVAIEHLELGPAP